jgi:hypothetical protein
MSKTDRPKFTTRSIILIGDQQKQLAKAAIDNAPNEIEVVMREVVKVRGLDQNGLYWKRLGEIAEQAWLQGRQFDADTWHYYCGRTVMPEEVTIKDGRTVSKWVEAPDGSIRVISTTLLEKGCFAAYTNAVEAFGANLGVHFSVNPNR